MHRLANAYLVGFALDAVLSVVDDAIGPSPLSALREVVATMVVLASIPMFWAMAFWRAIPRSVFLPLTLLVAWFVLGAVPVSIWFGTDGMLQVLSLLQLGFAGGALLRVRALTGGLWVFDAETLPDEPVDAGAAVRFAAVSLVVGPVVVVLVLGWGVALAVEQATAGFVRVGLDGVHLQERVYRDGDRTVRLVGMVHIAESSFYGELFSSLSDDEGTAILVEGVTDDDERLTESFSYEGVAKILDLDAQRAVALPETGRARIVWADVDISTFSDQTIEILDRMGAVLAHDRLADMLRALLEMANEMPLTEQDLEQVYHDIDGARSEHALSVLRDELARGESRVFVMPWGALHMAAFAEGVEAIGFELDATVERLAIAF